MQRSVNKQFTQQKSAETPKRLSRYEMTMDELHDEVEDNRRKENMTAFLLLENKKLKERIAKLENKPRVMQNNEDKAYDEWCKKARKRDAKEAREEGIDRAKTWSQRYPKGEIEFTEDGFQDWMFINGLEKGWKKNNKAFFVCMSSYYYKDTIKSLGFQYDAKLKLWVIPYHKVDEKLMHTLYTSQKVDALGFTDEATYKLATQPHSNEELDFTD